MQLTWTKELLAALKNDELGESARAIALVVDEIAARPSSSADLIRHMVDANRISAEMRAEAESRAEQWRRDAASNEAERAERIRRKKLAPLHVHAIVAGGHAGIPKLAGEYPAPDVYGGHLLFGWLCAEQSVSILIAEYDELRDVWTLLGGDDVGPPDFWMPLPVAP